MKIADMIKKIDTYNEISEMIRRPKVELRFSARFGQSVTVTDMKSFRKYIRSEYIDCVANAILNYDGYNLYEDATITTVDYFGDELHEEVEFTCPELW